jgi:hypothetical protein
MSTIFGRSSAAVSFSAGFEHPHTVRPSGKKKSGSQKGKGRRETMGRLKAGDQEQEVSAKGNEGSGRETPAHHPRNGFGEAVSTFTVKETLILI